MVAPRMFNRIKWRRAGREHWEKLSENENVDPRCTVPEGVSKDGTDIAENPAFKIANDAYLRRINCKFELRVIKKAIRSKHTGNKTGSSAQSTEGMPNLHVALAHTAGSASVKNDSVSRKSVSELGNQLVTHRDRHAKTVAADDLETMLMWPIPNIRRTTVVNYESPLYRTVAVANDFVFVEAKYRDPCVIITEGGYYVGDPDEQGSGPHVTVANAVTDQPGFFCFSSTFSHMMNDRSGRLDFVRVKDGYMDFHLYNFAHQREIVMHVKVGNGLMEDDKFQKLVAMPQGLPAEQMLFRQMLIVTPEEFKFLVTTVPNETIILDRTSISSISATASALSPDHMLYEEASERHHVLEMTHPFGCHRLVLKATRSTDLLVNLIEENPFSIEVDELRTVPHLAQYTSEILWARTCKEQTITFR